MLNNEWVGYLPCREESPEGTKESSSPCLAIALEVSASHSLHVARVRFIECCHLELFELGRRSEIGYLIVAF